MEEPLVSRGVASTLRLLMDRGVIGGNAIDKKDTSKENIREKKAPIVHLEYKDEHGRNLTPKEAFKLLSHKFHGKMPGKMKTEKLLKKIQTEKAIQSKSSSLLPSKLQIDEKSRASRGTAHIIVSNSTILASSTKPTTKSSTNKREREDSHSIGVEPKKKKIFGMK